MAAKSLGRKYIGIDVSKEYCDIATERLETERIEKPSTLDNYFEKKNLTFLSGAGTI